MKNKHVGFLVVGIAIIFLGVVYSFNSALATIVGNTCTHGSTCPMQTTLTTEMIISYSLVALLVLVALAMIFFMKEERVVAGSAAPARALSDEEKKKKVEGLDEEEKKVLGLVMDKDGSMYQSDLAKETQQSKVKITRILDRLEGRGLIERRRRGMTNIVLLK